MRTIVFWIVLLFMGYVFIHVFTAGQDEIIEGPPETPEITLTPDQ